MQHKEKSLVILAAGIGSRFKGGIKQLQNVGPAGECIMDYSIYDAVHAGFNRIVFIIRKDIEPLFEELIGSKVRPFCQNHGVEMLCVYQEKHMLPEGFLCPPDREKPWGTGQALLICKGSLNGGFVVVNADDFYGREAFEQMAAFLDGLEENTCGRYALAGFRLSNTLSDHGGVTRGLCSTDDQGFLTGIRETKKIQKYSQGPGVETSEGICFIDGNTPVSMNMWAFTLDVLDHLEERFRIFLAEGGLTDPRSEFLIPTEIGAMLSEGIEVKVIPTSTEWFGMTFREEEESVRAALTELTGYGYYPHPLF